MYAYIIIIVSRIFCLLFEIWVIICTFWLLTVSIKLSYVHIILRVSNLPNFRAKKILEDTERQQNIGRWARHDDLYVQKLAQACCTERIKALDITYEAVSNYHLTRATMKKSSMYSIYMALYSYIHILLYSLYKLMWHLVMIKYRRAKNIVKIMSTNVQGHEKNPNCSGCIQQHSIVWSTGATTQTLQERSNGIRGSSM